MCGTVLRCTYCAEPIFACARLTMFVAIIAEQLTGLWDAEAVCRASCRQSRLAVGGDFCEVERAFSLRAAGTTSCVSKRVTGDGERTASEAVHRDSLQVGL